MSGIVETVKHAVGAGGHKVNEEGYAAQKEVHKEGAKDSSAPVGDRIGHGVDAVKASFNENSEAAKKESDKKAAGIS